MDGVPAAKRASLAAIQQEIGEWSKRNFGMTYIKGDLRGLLLLTQHVGAIAHGMLKHSQGIRGTPEEHLTAIATAATRLREDLSLFVARSTTANAFPMEIAPFLGAIEEIGEFIEALFDQKLTDLERQKKLRDGYADMLVFWLDFGNRNGFNAEECLNEAWAVVRDRDWKKHKVDGGQPS